MPGALANYTLDGLGSIVAVGTSTAVTDGIWVVEIVKGSRWEGWAGREAGEAWGSEACWLVLVLPGGRGGRGGSGDGCQDNSVCCHGSCEEVKAGMLGSVLNMLVLLVRVAGTNSRWCSSEKLPCEPAGSSDCCYCCLCCCAC